MGLFDFLSSKEQRMFKAIEGGGGFRDLEQALNEGADVNAKNDKGRTVLVWAALNNCINVAGELLINRGAHVDAKDNEGRAALMWAALYNYLDVSELLINGGADVNMKDPDGVTSLMLAAMNNSLHVAELLISKGADINAIDNEGRTALMWADMNESLQVSELLIKNGASVSGRQVVRADHLHGHPRIISQSIEAGIDTVFKDIEITAKEINNGSASIIFAVPYPRAAGDLNDKLSEMNIREDRIVCILPDLRAIIEKRVRTIQESFPSILIVHQGVLTNFITDVGAQPHIKSVVLMSFDTRDKDYKNIKKIAAVIQPDVVQGTERFASAAYKKVFFVDTEYDMSERQCPLPPGVQTLT